METSAKTAINVEEAFLQTSQMIYENIDKGMYDLSSEKSGIRVGNESYTPVGGSGGANPGGTMSSGTKLGGQGGPPAKSGGGTCC